MSNLLFKPVSVEEHAFLLASHLPQGKAWLKAFDTDDTFGKLFLGLALEFYRFQVLEENLCTEMDIRQTNNLISEWEKSVGLPDTCFRVDINLAERRRQVEQKFSKFGGVQKAEDFIRVAAFFGFTVIVKQGKDIAGFPIVFPMGFFSSTKAMVHTIIIDIQGLVGGDEEFPLAFPTPFVSNGKSFLKCIFDELRPANCKIIVRT